jgi:long-chain acyl-CoA synthetase
VIGFNTGAISHTFKEGGTMEERIWHKAYAPGVPTTIDYEEMTLPAAFDRSVERFPDRTALIMMGKRISYRELSGLVNRFANALDDLGLKKGEKVALIMPNMPQMVIAAYAAFKLGGVVVMNNPLYTEPELQHQLSDSGSVVCICMDLLVPRIKKIQPNTQIRTIIACHIRDYLPFPAKQLFPLIKKGMHRKVTPEDGVLDFPELVKKYPATPVPNRVEYQDMAALLYTGGTTGLSKGVMLTHANCSTVVQQFRAWMTTAEDGRESVIAIFPFFHIAGFTAMMNMSMYSGYSVILVPRPEPKTVLDMTLKYRPTFFGCVPTIFVGLLGLPEFKKADFSFITGCISGAAPLALETIREWEDQVGTQIVEVYGMTESTTLCHANPWGGVAKVGSVGVPIPDTDCKIVDISDADKEMPQGESGEILIRGPQVTSGYYNKPEENANAFIDGWFATGDIGYMDEDGYLFIVDRKKDMIIAGGYNIYPRDIDEVLFGHPKIQEACAVGVADAYRGETVKAFIVLKPGAQLTEDEITAYCKERLAAYKVPKFFEFIDDLPKSTVGKVLRRKLRDMEAEKRA